MVVALTFSWHYNVRMSQDANSRVLSEVLDKIHLENPSYWPYGLSRRHLDGGAWLVRKSATHEPVGFVGWQERPENGKKVGYYAVGILPEHRGYGFAKHAVASLLAEKSATVDTVRAMIADHNSPSIALARSLGVPTMLIKTAAPGAGLIGRVGGKLTQYPWTLSTLGALGYDAALEQRHQSATHPGEGFSFTDWAKALNPGNDAMRTAQLLLNTGIIRTGAPMLANKSTVAGGIGALGGMIWKDLGLQGLGAMPSLQAAANRHAQPAEDAGGMGTGAKVGMGIGAAALAALVGSSIYNNNRRTQVAEDTMRRDQNGKIRVTLPTKNPGDQETQLEMPIQNVELSNTLMTSLRRDLRRRLRSESAARTFRRPGSGSALAFNAQD